MNPRVLHSIGLLAALLFSLQLHAQKDYSHLDLRAPVDIPIYLSGNFGEFRSNHFHTGLDIKTQGREGIPVFASERGFISRVRVSPFGYGNALYIEHPNGFTTVYAHLSAFGDEVARWVEEQQYALESFEVDLEVPSHLFRLEKGQQIGLSGNSGGSFGPHLHYEIRQTATEFPMNGLLFGFDIQDTRPPEITAIWVFELAGSNPGIGRRIPLRNKGEVMVPGEILFSRTGTFGMAIETIDRLNGASNRCGVYRIDMTANGDTVYTHEMEKLDFEKNRFINAHMLSDQYSNKKRDVHRSWLVPNNQLDIYDTENRGVLTVAAGDTVDIAYRVIDAYGNQRRVKAQVVRGQFQPSDGSHPGYAYNKSHFIPARMANVYLPKGCMYDDTPVPVKLRDPLSGAISPSVQIGNSDIPLQESIVIELPAGELPAHLQSKALITRWGGSRHRAAGGTYQFGWVTAYVKKFGRYQVMIDSTAPVIKAQRLNDGGVFRFTITDNLSGIAHYEGRVDGAWVLCTYDYKKNRLEFVRKKGQFSDGKHELEIIVTDERGNEARYTHTFTI